MSIWYLLLNITLHSSYYYIASLNIDEDIFSELIVDYGFQRELYQSIKRLIKNHGETKDKIKVSALI